MNEETMLELAYLRYFYREVQPALGPADHDIMVSIQREYKGLGGVLPSEYDYEIDDEDTDYNDGGNYN